MKSLLPILVILLTGLAPLGCKSKAGLSETQTQPEAHGDFPDQYEAVVRDYIVRKLQRDPGTAYRISEPPYRGYLRNRPAQGGQPSRFGWVVEVYVEVPGTTPPEEERIRLLLRDNAVLSRIQPATYFEERWYQL